MLNRRNLILAASAIFATLTLSTAPQTAHADALAGITARGTLRVAVPQHFPHFGSAGTDMVPQG
jgi:polar amino acid transport system substrate-binding protein